MSQRRMERYVVLDLPRISLDLSRIKCLSIAEKAKVDGWEYDMEHFPENAR